MSVTFSTEIDFLTLFRNHSVYSIFQFMMKYDVAFKLCTDRNVSPITYTKAKKRIYKKKSGSTYHHTEAIAHHMIRCGSATNSQMIFGFIVKSFIYKILDDTHTILSGALKKSKIIEFEGLSA